MCIDIATKILTRCLLGALLPLPLAALAADEIADESWNLKGQATYIWQKKPSFNAAYSGANSLSPEAEKSYSFSGTLFFGMRLWRGGELYVDPEVVQAVPMSKLTGLGGMANSEQQKSGGPNPTLYRARLFVRQTWGLGGEQEAQESTQNQLAGMVDKHRIVLTVGNNAIIDVFDNNAYAHDGRTQFLNWALLTHGAFDYAADTRGYTWGASLEYYHDDWVVRGGRYLVPVESNGQQLDTRIFKYYGDQLELEHGHTLGGQPGKLRLLAFRNKAVMGSFQEALKDAPNNGGIPDVARVRRAQTKYGFGISAEQAISSDVGVFARASWNDGATETYSFTEIERSVSVGTAIKGTGWGRAADVLGAALIQNGLSRAHQDYLAAGGVGAFIGDGKINYRPEQIVELYYNIGLSRNLSLMFDVQRFFNPAYNADRGPVTIGGVRLHAEF